MKAWKFLPVAGVAAALALVFILSKGMQPAEARQLFSKGEGGCLFDTCPNYNSCTANDVQLVIVETYAAEDRCDYLYDTGQYMFRAYVNSSTANQRYDVGWWVANDGTNAKNGACYSDYLEPPLLSSGLPNPPTPIYGPPFWDLEYADNGGTDACGDIRKNQPTYDIFGPVTISCSQRILNQHLIDTCTAWDQNSNSTCPANNNCGGSGPKCNCQEAYIEINLNQIDLALTKDTNATYFPGETFTYTIQVTNNSVYTSTGFVVTDTLDSRLIYVSSTPPVCSASGQNVTCNVTQDLPPAASYTFYMQVQVDPDYTGYDIIPNFACVKGFEIDPVSTNNCDDADVPTPVEMLSFTATGADKTILLSWETASEMEIVGFNLYRSRLPLRNYSKLIYSTAAMHPGKPFGDIYQYTDMNVKIGRSYTYWLEVVMKDGSTSFLDPITFHLSSGFNLPFPFRPHYKPSDNPGKSFGKPDWW